MHNALGMLFNVDGKAAVWYVVRYAAAGAVSLLIVLGGTDVSAALGAKTSLILGFPCNSSLIVLGGPDVSAALGAKTSLILGVPCNSSLSVRGGTDVSAAHGAKTSLILGFPCGVVAMSGSVFSSRLWILRGGGTTKMLA